MSVPVNNRSATTTATLITTFESKGRVLKYVSVAVAIMGVATIAFAAVAFSMGGIFAGGLTLLISYNLYQMSKNVLRIANQDTLTELSIILSPHKSLENQLAGRINFNRNLTLGTIGGVTWLMDKLIRAHFYLSSRS